VFYKVKIEFDIQFLQKKMGYTIYDKKHFNKLAQTVKVSYKNKTGSLVGIWFEDRDYPEYIIREDIYSKKDYYVILYDTCWTSTRYSYESSNQLMKNHPLTSIHPEIGRFYPPMRECLASFFEMIRKNIVYGIDEKDDKCKRWVLLIMLCLKRIRVDVPFEMILTIGRYLRYSSII